MSEIDIQTEKEAAELEETVRYAGALLLLIKKNIDTYQECLVEDKHFTGMWGGKPWLSATGNLHERIKKFADKHDLNVDWPEKGLAQFTRKVPCIIVGPRLVDVVNYG